MRTNMAQRLVAVTKKLYTKKQISTTDVLIVLQLKNNIEYFIINN
jgi:hypothetical protein